MRHVTSEVTGNDEYVRHELNGLVTAWDDPTAPRERWTYFMKDRRLLTCFCRPMPSDRSRLANVGGVIGGVRSMRCGIWLPNQHLALLRYVH